jgi:1-phosphatidylinositol-4-phosphate 5-kinase
MEFFMRDILLSVAYCIKESKSYDTNISIIDFEKENESSIKHTINLNTFNLDDQSVSESQFIDVKIIDYAPRIFAYLRSLENIDIDQMSESFLPKNNKKGISESQGKSGSFFISTDDNQYMIKTLKVDEFDLIRKTFLNEYEKYIKKNPNSLLCRIYGMYNIILSQGEEILIIVMRNVIGEFKDNIMAKYDLKGSTKNRATEFDMEKLSEKTLKDLNFNEIEKGIFMSSDSIATFRNLIKYDALFLRRMELMDYSLFLVKLTLSKEQISDLFGEEIQEIQEKEFKELMEGSGVKNNNICKRKKSENKRKWNSIC